MKTATKLQLIAATALGSLAITSFANAGGFAVREQSTSAQGSSFAGAAAGFDLSSMFWNPAAVTGKEGQNSESHAAVILGQSRLTSESGALDGLPTPPFADSSGNIADPALVTSSYANYQFGNFYVGYSLNAPFGLTTKPERNWKGQTLGSTSKLLTVNFSPTVGYKVAPGVSVAVGAQVQYIDARLTSFLPAGQGVIVTGEDYGFGFTAGIMFEPTSSTKIGIGFRSSVAHTLEGKQVNTLAGVPAASRISAKAELPEIATLSLRQKVNSRFTFLGTVEWTNWSRVKTIDINCKTADGTPVGCAAPGDTLSTLDLNYDDGWFFAAGVEYAFSPKLLLRTGLAYEISPAREDSSRTVRIADNDRIWASVGATYSLNANMALDFAYTHIFVKDGKIEQDEPAFLGGGSFVADVDSSVDIISASFKYKWGGHHQPLK